MTLRRLRIEDCERRAVNAFITVGSVHNILLDGIEFFNNKNTKGPSCISSTLSTVTLHNITAVGNSGHGGGSVNMKTSTINVYDSTLKKNSAIGPSDGGAMTIIDCDLSASNTVFEGNSGVNGGAVYVSTGVSTQLLFVAWLKDKHKHFLSSFLPKTYHECKGAFEHVMTWLWLYNSLALM